MDTQSERWELRRSLLFAPLTILKELIIIIFYFIIILPLLIYTRIPQQYPLQNLCTWSVNQVSENQRLANE